MILREINRSDKKPTDLKAKNSLPGVIIIRILSQHQDAGRHLNWQ